MSLVETDDYVTVPDAAKRLGESQAAIRMAIKQKRLPAVKFAGRNWIPRPEFEKYVADIEAGAIHKKGRPRGAVDKKPRKKTTAAREGEQADADH
ncbi:MAG TPA: helix-turn-helix domain-containing protein [Bryobacteraceae bacterium]|nr:helix-turn-helix domain-containing protein [Bryobacteraceae bacterium]